MKCGSYCTRRWKKDHSVQHQDRRRSLLGKLLPSSHLIDQALLEIILLGHVLPKDILQGHGHQGHVLLQQDLLRGLLLSDVLLGQICAQNALVLEKNHKLLNRNQGHQVLLSDILQGRALLNGLLHLSNVLTDQVVLGHVLPAGALQDHALLDLDLRSGVLLRNVLLAQRRPPGPSLLGRPSTRPHRGPRLYRCRSLRPRCSAEPRWGLNTGSPLLIGNPAAAQPGMFPAGPAHGTFLLNQYIPGLGHSPILIQGTLGQTQSSLGQIQGVQLALRPPHATGLTLGPQTGPRPHGEHPGPPGTPTLVIPQNLGPRPNIFLALPRMMSPPSFAIVPGQPLTLQQLQAMLPTQTMLAQPTLGAFQTDQHQSLVQIPTFTQP
ncbi:hypothetical protein MRX96_015599 [Rhipicephalus microplus]